MKTYACPGCGDRYQVTADYETDCQNCGREMHALDGVIRGGGVMAIWRDGKEIWSGTGLEAVEQLAIHLQLMQSRADDAMRSGDYITSSEYIRRLEQAAEADRIVRKAADTYGTMPLTLEAMIQVRSDACEYVNKYPKT